MGTQAPDIARLGDRLLGNRRDVVFVSEAVDRLLSERLVQLRRRKAKRLKVGAQQRQILQLAIQHLAVPAGIQSDTVVGEHQFALLQVGQTREHDDRHHRYPSCLAAASRP